MGRTKDHLARTQQRTLRDLVMVCADDFEFSEAPNVCHGSLAALAVYHFYFKFL